MARGRLIDLAQDVERLEHDLGRLRVLGRVAFEDAEQRGHHRQSDVRLPVPTEALDAQQRRPPVLGALALGEPIGQLVDRVRRALRLPLRAGELGIAAAQLAEA